VKSGVQGYTCDTQALDCNMPLNCSAQRAVQLAQLLKGILNPLLALDAGPGPEHYTYASLLQVVTFPVVAWPSACDACPS